MVCDSYRFESILALLAKSIREQAYEIATTIKPGLFTRRGHRDGEGLFHGVLFQVCGLDSSPTT